MKTIVEHLRHHGILCKKLTEVLPKTLGSRKRVGLYIGVDLSGYYCSVMVIDKQSRVLKKEAEVLAELHAKLEEYHGTPIREKYIRVNAPLCSKAQSWMEQEGWVFLT